MYHRGAISLVQTTYQQEGLRAFFQGLAPRLLTYSCVKFTLFMLYDELYARTESTVIAGGVAGGINTVISCPQDVLKSRLQMQIAASGSGYQGPVKTARNLLGKHGPQVFYRGWQPLVARDTLAYAVLFSIFYKTKESGQVPVWLCGGLSGVGFYMSTLPIDRVKTIMMTQVQAVHSKPPLFERIIMLFYRASCSQSILAQQSVLGIYIEEKEYRECTEAACPP